MAISKKQRCENLEKEGVVLRAELERVSTARNIAQEKVLALERSLLNTEQRIHILIKTISRLSRLVKQHVGEI